jgi:hypothetical protein
MPVYLLLGNRVVRIRRSTSSHKFSIGLRSGDCAGHCKISTSARTEDALKKHQNVCFSNEPCVPIMPEDNKNIQRMLRQICNLF